MNSYPMQLLKQLLFRCGIAMVATTFMAQAAQAQLLAYEGFDYETGGLIDVGGGTLGSGFGWATEGFNTGGGTIPGAEGKFNGWYYECYPNSCGGNPYNNLGTVVDAAPPGWGYTDSEGNELPTAGGRSEVANYEAFVRQLDLSGVDSSLLKPPVNEFGFDKLGVDNTSVWISFLGEGTEIQSTAAIGLGQTADEDYSGFQRSVNLGRPWMLHEDGSQAAGESIPTEERNRAWGILDTGPTIDPVAATGDLYNEKVFYVARVNFGAGPLFEGERDETIDVWTNPVLGTTAPSDATAAISDFTAYSFDFNAIRLGGNANTFFDEIRIGLSYGDVAPIAAGATTDFDDDGDVDGNDFLKWQREFGVGLTATDLSNWRNEYGAGFLSAVTAVPEPTSALLFSFAIAGLSLRRRGMLGNC